LQILNGGLSPLFKLQIVGCHLLYRFFQGGVTLWLGGCWEMVWFATQNSLSDVGMEVYVGWNFAVNFVLDKR